MDLTSCLQRTTHRQYLAWQQWLETQWNKPSLTHWYLMQIAQMVKKPTKLIPLDNFKLSMARKEAPVKDDKKSLAQNTIELSKAMWRMRLGIGKKK